MKMSKRTYCRRARVLAPDIHPVLGAVGLAALIVAAGCSFQNFDELTNGSGTTTLPSVGGATHSGGTGGVSLGGSSSTVGGTTAIALGGSSQSGTQTVPSQGGGTGGSPSGGASFGPCPEYTGTPGTVLTPPSNTFENNMTGWTTVSEHVSLLSVVADATTACQGSSYLQCSGAGRTAEWDGPAINVLPYLTQGHTYNASVAARFDPQNPPAATSVIMFSMALTCTDSSVSTTYLRIKDGATLTNWIRLTGSLTTSVAACPTLARLLVYVESDTTAAANTLQVDDFQLIDTTAGSGTGGAPGTGAGGTAAIGGAATTGGVTAAGGAPAGGAPSGGGMPATGGVMSTGGTDASDDGGLDGG